jgi:nicotinate-nucleotide adenylyltransferase
MKIGLFFGSFNPIHIGHLALANYFVEFTDLDKIWFIISPQNPFKEQKSLLADYHRIYMVRLAIEKYEQKYMASNIEFDMPKPSYTIDTLTYLKEKYTNFNFVLIMGADNLLTLYKWKNYKEIVNNYEIYVYPRPNYEIKSEKIDFNYKLFEAPQFDISSSFIRNSIKENKKVPFFLPENVYKFIEEMSFYKK